jgi:hypothetical protein
MRSFGRRALKKTDRSTRSDKKDGGDCGGDEETDEDALRDDLQDASAALGQFQTMAVSDSWEHGFNPSARPQEGGAI